MRIDRLRTCRAASALVVVSSLLVSAHPALGGECRDEDGDRALAGVDCALATDCNDLAWEQRPGAPELCNGFDDDCDGVLDEGCARDCPDPNLFPLSTRLRLDTGEKIGGGSQLAFTSRGIFTMMREGVSIPGLQRLRLRSFDDAGRPFSPSLRPQDDVLGDETIDDEFEIVDAGDRVLVLWDQITPGERKRLYARVVDELGSPVGPLIDVGATLPEPLPPYSSTAVFDGQRFQLLWVPAHLDLEQRKLYATTIRRDGTLPDEPTRLVTTEERGFFLELAATWADDRTILVAAFSGPDGEEPSTFVIDRDDQLLASEPLPWSVRTSSMDLTWIGDRAALAWGDSSASVPTAFLGFIDAAGAPLADEALRLEGVGMAATFGTSAFVAWNGELLGVLLSNRRGQLVSTPDWYFWRVLPDGTLLDSPGRTFGTDVGDAQALASSGEDFRFGSYEFVGSDPEFLAWSISCACTDEDGDGFDTCQLGDCDDTDPEVNRLAAERCGGGKDDDCNGLIDCDDPACSVTLGPPAIETLRWDGGALVWDPVPSAITYDVARGLMSDVLRRADLRLARCVGFELGATTWFDDGRLPPEGDALWYLVRPEGTPCALGPWAVDQVRELPACR